ncbi:MAG: hypothetical protein GX577_14060 [Leptolinea sp.]|nr:hypothetical protein [Leptolinea sp.]
MIHGIHLFSSVLGKPALYLDPGSGSFILQVLLAAILGGGFAIKAYWKKIKAIFVKTPPEEVDEEESDEKA